MNKCKHCDAPAMDGRTKLCGIHLFLRDFHAKWKKQCECGRWLKRSNQIRCVDCKRSHDNAIRLEKRRLSSSICADDSRQGGGLQSPTASTLDPLNATS